MKTQTVTPHLLLLCRHTRRDEQHALLTAVLAMEGGSDEDAETAAELAELVAVAERVEETLGHENVRLAALFHAPSTIATTHAAWLKRRLLGPRDPDGFRMEPHPDLNPGHFMSWPGTEPADELMKQLLEPLDAPADGPRGGRRAVLVVGHMPQLAWLGSRLTRNRSPGRRLLDGHPTPLSLRNGEVAAIALTGTHRGRPRGHLEWTAAPDETDAIEALREKIMSKMDTAKLLGGFMTLVLGGVILAPGRLTELSSGGDRWAVYVAAVSFLIAIGLYLRTMYAYDSLLMPKRYWGEAAPGRLPPGWLVRRPPSSAAWVLYQNMLQVWTFLFTPATVAVAVGLLALAYAALEPTWGEGLIASAVLIVTAAYALWRRPVLGSQD